MIIGHAPAGYVVSRLLLARLAPASLDPKWLVCAGVVGAIAPDFDMLYFHLVDHRMHHHHTYLTHLPIVWGPLLLASIAWWGYFRGGAAALAVVFTLNGFLHLVLDSIVGDIWWLAPFVDEPFSLFTLERTYEPWWLNFILHPSFALEVVLVVWAICLWRGANRTPQKTFRLSTMATAAGTPKVSRKIGSSSATE